MDMTDAPAWDAAERQSLLDRATKLAAANGLKIADGAALVDQLDAAGVSIFFHHHRPDADVLAKLQTLCKPAAKAVPEADAKLTGPGPKNVEFTAWLGGLAATYDRMPPMRRLQLWRDFTSGVRPAMTAAPIGVKPTRVAPITSTPAMAGMTGAQKLQHLDLTRSAQRIARELAGLKASQGGGHFVQSARAAAISKCEAQLASLAERGVIL
jgi:hypothetical protein